MIEKMVWMTACFWAMPSLCSKTPPRVFLVDVPVTNVSVLSSPGECWNKSMSPVKFYPSSWRKPDKQQIKIRLQDGQCSSDLLWGNGDPGSELKFEVKRHDFHSCLLDGDLQVTEPSTCEWRFCWVGVCKPSTVHCQSSQYCQIWSGWRVLTAFTQVPGNWCS